MSQPVNSVPCDDPIIQAELEVWERACGDDEENEEDEVTE